MLVRNESWHHGNVVLLGDAAHTAHFSIGSGTKLAMEDAIALAQAFARHPGDVERALVDYELERQPVVERFQQAAGESAAYFTRVERYAHMEPMPFAFNLLTRSGRVTHANLAQRDPQFVRVLDAWFHGGGERPGAVAPPPLFAPWQRAAQPRRARRAATPRDMPELARSGAGLVLAGPVAVTPDGRISPDTPTLDGALGRARRTRCMRPARRPACCSRTPGGAARRARASHGADIPLREGGWPLIAPSPIAVRAAHAGAARDDGRGHGRGARRVRRRRARAPRTRASTCSSSTWATATCSARSSRPPRTGATTSTAADRLRFPLEVLDAVRDAWPEDRLLAVRLGVMDGTRRGLQLRDGHRDRARAGRARLRARPRRRRADRARGRAGGLPPRVPHAARRPRARRGAACRRSSAAT